MPIVTIRAIVILLFSFFIMTACTSSGARSGKVNCPAFDDKELSDWLPYHDQQELIFHSGFNAYDTFTLKNIETTPSHEVITGSFGETDGCDAYKTFASLEVDSFNASRLYIQLHTQTPFHSGGRHQEANINLNGNTVDMAGLTPGGFSVVKINNKNTRLQYAAKVMVQNHPYTNVQIAIRDTAIDKSPGIYQVYISKGAGIVAYTDDSTTWIRQ